MAVPSELLWPRDPHTEAKHRVLRGYLDAWWPILLSRYPRVTYAEGYAGPGEYEGGEDGSPVVALRSLLERDDLDLEGRQAHVVLVEKREDRLHHCLEQIDERLGPLPDAITLHPRVGRCEEDLLAVLRQSDAFGSPILVNLDPFGPGVPYDVIREMADNPSSEVLISFMVQWFIRFPENTDLGHGDRQFGTDAWREVTEVPTEEKRRWLTDLYRQRLHDAGFDHTAWFDLVDESGQAFSLIFATTSRKGLRKMKESFWRVDPVRGIQFRDPRDPGQLAFDISEDPYLVPLQNLLTERLDGRPQVLVKDLRDWTLEETVFLPTHAMVVLRDLRDQNRLEVDAPGRLQINDRVTLHNAPRVETEPPPQQLGLL